jgi:dephospho-CoA kinase
MLKVGLTGGLASGKTFVAGLLEQYGCRVIHADRLGHEALLPGGGAYDDAVREFGPSILLPDGRIDRKALGAIVFEDSQRLQALNALVHPHVFRREEEFLERVAREDPQAIAVVEAAIMIEAGSYQRYERLIVTYCDEATQIRRFMEREEATEAEVRARLRHQMPLEAKRNYADYVIDTSGSKDETARQAGEVYGELLAEAQGKGRRPSRTVAPKSGDPTQRETE